LGSLLDVAAHNSARGMVDLRLFEMGTLFVLDDTPTLVDGGEAAGRAGERAGTGVREQRSLAALLSGRIAPATWGAPEPAKADLFAIKGVLEALGAALRVQLDCRAGTQPFLHPGRCATVSCEGVELGWLGELHPLVAREWNLDGAALFELDLDRLLEIAARESAYRDVISYPALRQDLAVSVAETISSAEVTEAIRQAAGGLLRDVEVFDVYTGRQAGPGNKSIAMHLTFQASDRTLTDDEVKSLVDRLLRHLLETLGAAYRA
jgi:phenylalanyl-tRNA synthetase beta chain